MVKSDYRLNMSKDAERLFLKAFKDESWTWDGLSRLLKLEFPNDIEDLIYCLKCQSGEIHEANSYTADK